MAEIVQQPQMTKRFLTWTWRVQTTNEFGLISFFCDVHP